MAKKLYSNKNEYGFNFGDPIFKTDSYARGGNLFGPGGFTNNINLGNYSLDDMDEQQLRNLSTELFFQGDMYNAQKVADRVNAYSAPRVAKMNRIANASKPIGLPEVTITPDSADRAEYAEAMSQPYYQAQGKPSFEEWKNRRDLALKAQGEIKAMPTVNPIVDTVERGLRNYIGELKYDVANNEVPSGKYGWPAAIATAAGMTGLASLPALGETAYASGITPTITGGVNRALMNVFTPGSPFWSNPLTQGMLAGTIGSEVLNEGTRLTTGYKSHYDENGNLVKDKGYSTVGDVIGGTVENLTGWNPNNTWLGPLVTESFNPGWYVSPTALMNPISRATDLAGTTLNNMFSRANLAKTKRTLFGNEHQPNIIQRALGKPNKHNFLTWDKTINSSVEKAIKLMRRGNLFTEAGNSIWEVPVGKKNVRMIRIKPLPSKSSSDIPVIDTEFPKFGKIEIKETPDKININGNNIEGKTQNVVYTYKLPKIEDTVTKTPVQYGSEFEYKPSSEGFGEYSEGDYETLFSFRNAGNFPNAIETTIPGIDPGSAEVFSAPIKNDAAFTEALQKYMQELESQYGYPVVGSTRGIANGYFGGFPKDTEIIVPKDQVQDAFSKLEFNLGRKTKGDTGVTGFSDKAFIGKDGRENLDINMLDDSGTIIHQLESTRNPEKMPSLYDDLAKQQANAGKAGTVTKSADLNIPKETGTGNYTAQEYFDTIKKDKELLNQSVVDNLFKSHSKKHISRAYAMMNNNNPDAVKKVSAAIDHMVAQIPKMKRFSKLYSSQKFDNVEKNKEILEKIGFIPVEADKFASNPEQMKNIVDYWYMRKTVGARSVNYEKSPRKTNSFEEVMQAMRQLGYGSSAGGGGNEILGNTFGGYTRDYTAYNYHDPMLDKKTATFDDVFKYFEREKNIWTDPNTKDIIRQVFKEHGIDLDMYPTTYDTFENARDYSYFTDDVYNMVHNKFIPSEEGDKLIRDVSERLGVSGYRGEPYGSHNFSEYGDYYGAMQRPGLSGKNSEPLSAHRNIDSGDHNMPIMPAEWGSDEMFFGDSRFVEQIKKDYMYKARNRHIDSELYIDPDLPVLTSEEAAKLYPEDFLDLEPYIVREAREVYDPNDPYSSFTLDDNGNIVTTSLPEEIERSKTVYNLRAEAKKFEDEVDKLEKSTMELNEKRGDWKNRYTESLNKYERRVRNLKDAATTVTPIGLTAAGASYIMHNENEKNEKALAALNQYVKNGVLKEIKDSDGNTLKYKIQKNKETTQLMHSDPYIRQLLRHHIIEWEPDVSIMEGLEETNQKAYGGNLYDEKGNVLDIDSPQMKFFMEKATNADTPYKVWNIMKQMNFVETPF